MRNTTEDFTASLQEKANQFCFHLMFGPYNAFQSSRTTARFSVSRS
jgi:hypothetical protein